MSDHLKHKSQCDPTDETNQPQPVDTKQSTWEGEQG